MQPSGGKRGLMGSQTATPRFSNTKPLTQKNIDSILELEKEDERKLSQFHRVSHTVGGFVGTVHFVTAQCVTIAAWLSLNVHLFNITPFDPYPFSLLSLVLTLEAEEEAATTLNILRAVADRLHVDVPQEPEHENLPKDTPVESIAQDLRKREAKAD
jgi:uncharacterized membrane protein